MIPTPRIANPLADVQRVRFLATAFRRILLVILLIFIFAVVRTFVVWAVCNTGMKTAATLEKQGLPALKELASLQENLALYRLDSYEFLFAQESQKPDCAKAADEVAFQMRAELKKIQTLFPEGDGRQLAANLEHAIDDLDTRFQKVRKLVDSDFPAAMKSMDLDIPPGTERVNAAANALKEFGYRLSGGQASATFAGFGSIKNTAVLFGVGNTVVALFAFVFVLTAAYRSRAQLAETLARLDERTHELQQTADLLQRQQTELRVLFDLMPAMIWFKDTQNGILRVNQRVADSIGKTVAEIEGKPSLEIYPVEAAGFYADDLEVIHSGMPKIGYVESLRSREGKELWVQTDKVPVCDETGKVIGIVVMAQDVTERRRTDEMVRRLAAIVENSDEAIIGETLEGIITNWNRAAEKMFGYTAQEIIGRPLQLIIPPEQPSNESEILAGFARDETVCRFETIRVRKDGRRFDASTTISPIKDAVGRIVGASKIVRDVTERNLAGNVLRESEERFSSAFEFAPIGMALVAPDGRWLKVNRAICALVGYSEVELLARTFQDITHPDDLAADMECVRRLLAGEIRSYEMEKRYVHARGHFVSILLDVSLIRDAQAQPLYFIAQIQDITERKRVSSALLASQRFLRSTLDALSSHIAILDEHGTIIEVNAAWNHFARANDFLDSHGVGDNYLKVCDSASGNFSREAPAVADGIRAVIAGQCEEFQLEYPCHGPHEKRWFLVRVTRFAGDGPVRIVVAHENITQRRRAEEELSWKTAFLEAQVNSSIDGILVVDQKDIKTIQNQRLADLLKIPRHIVDDKDDEKQRQWVTSMVKNPREFGEKIAHLNSHPDEISRDEIDLKDGTILDRYSAPVVGLDGKYYGRIWTFRDITGRKQLEAQLVQSQKLETVGKLAGGIAHEFNSILTAIIGQSELLLGELPAGSPLAKNATEITKAASRAAILTRQLLAYGRKQFLQPESLDLNLIVAGMTGIFHNLMGGDVDVQIVPAADLHAVQADAGQIEQVIVNIAMNARDAMPDGGKLTLETANVSFNEGGRDSIPELKPGDYVMLAITDTGAGMSDAVKARLFEPFFTTKGVGQGTGLGLSTSYGIVKQSGGHISVHSEIGRGTTFKIYLPQVESQAKIPIQRLDSPDLPRGTETILLVEDDPSLREMAAALLRRLGYTVFAAANGIEALGLKNKPGTGHIDLLFTDVFMPHMNGRESAGRASGLYPGTKILFATAYAEDAIVRQGVARLQKPFTPAALARKLREVLDQPDA